MSIRAALVVPAVPALLAGPDASPPAARAVARALTSLPTVDTAVLLTAGPEAMLPDGHRVHVEVPGDDSAVGEVAVDRALLGAVATRTSTPRLRADQLEGAPAVLAALVARVRPEVALVPLCVARGAAASTLAAVAAGLAGAIATKDRRVAIVADGTLGTAPGGADPEADTWARTAVDGLADPDAFDALGPSAATERGAEGWAPLTVLAHLVRAVGLRLDDAELVVADGTTQLVAR